MTGIDGGKFETSITGNEETGYTIQNTERPTAKDFSFRKIWRPAVGIESIEWPDGKSITVTVKQDSNVYATYTISKSDLTVGSKISANNDPSNEKVKLTVTAADASTGYGFKLIGVPYGDYPVTHTYTVSEQTVDGCQPPKYFDESGTQVMGAAQIGEGGTISNDQIGQVLPNTGGIGTDLFHLLGAMMILTAGAVIFIRRKRRRTN